jgi:hypothetical protein
MFQNDNSSLKRIIMFESFENDKWEAEQIIKHEKEINVLIKDKINKHKDLFNAFKFRQISSREHLFSQEHAKRYSIDEAIYNGIGNLCLISTSQNSAGNKENPADKKKMFQNDNSSLKRIIMFESFENQTEKWEVKQIEKHQEEINALIKDRI